MLTIEKETKGLSYRTLAAFYIKYFSNGVRRSFVNVVKTVFSRKNRIKEKNEKSFINLKICYLFPQPNRIFVNSSFIFVHFAVYV